MWSVCNSHDHSVLQSIDITRRNLMLITLRAFKWVNKEWICFSSILWTERNGPLILSLYLFSRHWFLLSVSNIILNYFLKGRRRVVPHFSSGTVCTAAETRALVKITPRENRRNQAKPGGEREEACRLFSRGVNHTRARVSLALLSLRKDRRLLVV